MLFCFHCSLFLDVQFTRPESLIKILWSFFSHFNLNNITPRLKMYIYFNTMRSSLSQKKRTKTWHHWTVLRVSWTRLNVCKYVPQPPRSLKFAVKGYEELAGSPNRRTVPASRSCLSWKTNYNLYRILPCNNWLTTRLRAPVFYDWTVKWGTAADFNTLSCYSQSLKTRASSFIIFFSWHYKG